MVLLSDGQEYTPAQAQNSNTLENSQQMSSHQMTAQPRAGEQTVMAANAGMAAGSASLQNQQAVANQDAYGRGTDLAPETTEMPPWGPPTGDEAVNIPSFPDMPSWGPPAGDEAVNIPSFPDMPSWEPPESGILPGFPDMPPWGPPESGILPGFPDMPPWGPPACCPAPPSAPEGNFEGYCNIRFLYAAVDQPPLNIRINGQAAINNFQYGNVTPYYLEEAGPISIALTSVYNPGFAFLNTRFHFQSGFAYTVAIINTATGIQLYAITDNACRGNSNAGCVRAVNLSYGSEPFDVFLSSGGRIFRSVGFKSITPYRQLRQGAYRAYVSEALPCISNQNIIISGNAYVACNNVKFAIIDSTMLNVMNNVSYTLYIIGRAYQFPALQLLPVESDLIY